MAKTKKIKQPKISRQLRQFINWKLPYAESASPSPFKVKEEKITEFEKLSKEWNKLQTRADIEEKKMNVTYGMQEKLENKMAKMVK